MDSFNKTSDPFKKSAAAKWDLFQKAFALKLKLANQSSTVSLLLDSRFHKYTENIMQGIIQAIEDQLSEMDQ